MKLKKIFKAGADYLTQPDFRFLINAGFGFYDRMADREYLLRKYKAKMGTNLNLDDPKTFNEKLQWLKLYDRRPEYTMMADKVAVRDHIAKTVGEEHLIPCLGVWDDPEDIDFDALPNQFVLKCNHNSGLGMCICTDKSKLDIAEVKKGLKKGLAQDYYLTSREWPYKNIKRQIIAEKYMVDESGTELKDYKVMCFGGEAKMIQVHSGRFQNHLQDFYDAQWNRQDIFQEFPQFPQPVEKLAFLEEMLELSERLSAGIPQLRVDWYYVNGQLYFGELTFFDGAGFDAFEPVEWDFAMGSWIQLPDATKIIDF